MSIVRVLYHIARADYFERVRRYSFLVILALAVYLGYLVSSGQIDLQLDDYRGIYNSAWVGALMGLVATLFVGLFGFYLVKNSLERDRQTGVGQIIATTPISKPVYLLGKWLSNSLVLGNLLVILALAAIFLQLWQGEDLHLDLWALFSPLLLVALPPLLFVAALAVLFETLPGLRGGVGNVAYFLLFMFSIAFIVQVLPDRLSAFDPLGTKFFMNDMASVLGQSGVQNYRGGFSLGSDGTAAIHTFTWPGIAWTLESMLARLSWALVAAGAVVLAALFFDRFADSGGWRQVSSRHAGGGRHADRPLPAGQPVGADLVVRPGLDGLEPANDKTTIGGIGAWHEEMPTRFSPPAPAFNASQLSPVGRRYAFVPVLAGELLLLLKGRSKGWWLVLAGLQVLALAAPVEDFSPLAGLVWIWPLLVWSGMGCRENRHRSAELVFSAPYPLAGQLPAAWLAGVLVTAFTGLGIGLHHALAGNLVGLAVWLAAIVFIPSLALSAGIWSGSSRLFEVLYVLIWYIGPMNSIPALNYVAGPLSTAGQFAVLSLVLLAVAMIGRRQQTRSY